MLSLIKKVVDYKLLSMYEDTLFKLGTKLLSKVGNYETYIELRFVLDSPDYLDFPYSQRNPNNQCNRIHIFNHVTFYLRKHNRLYRTFVVGPCWAATVLDRRGPPWPIT